MKLTFHDLDARRDELGITALEICRAARLSITQYSKWRAGTNSPRTGTLTRLSLAARRVANGSVYEAGQSLQVYRLALVLCALQAGMDPAVVLQHDPTRRAAANKEWMAAAQVRRRALYIAHVCCGISQAVLAKEARMTTAAVSLAILAIEETRGETDDDAIGVIERVMQLDA